MNPEIVSTLIQASGAAGVSAIFIFYLVNRDKSDREMIDKFNMTIREHISNSVRVMQEISDASRHLSETNKELKDVIEKLYQQNWELSKRVKKS